MFNLNVGYNKRHSAPHPTRRNSSDMSIIEKLSEGNTNGQNEDCKVQFGNNAGT
jgi:hypothetical protein